MSLSSTTDSTFTENKKHSQLQMGTRVNELTQGVSGTEIKIISEEDQGGYMATLHSLEAQCYGPDIAFDNKSKVFYFIRHETIRNWVKRKAISKKNIIAATGVDGQNLHRILRFLESHEMILVHRSKTGKIWNENEYELHPKRFGTDFIYREKGLRLVSGGVASNSPNPLESNRPNGVASNSPNQTPVLEPPERLPSSLKNMSKEPSLKNTTRQVVSQKRGFKAETWKEIRDLLLKTFPNDRKRLDYAFKQISSTKAYPTSHGPIKSPKAWIKSCWFNIREDYEFIDQQEKAFHRALERDKEDQELEEKRSLPPEGFFKNLLKSMPK